MLKGKCAIVTGASRGIGKAIALKLASLGANIVLNYRSNEKEALEVENEIKGMGVETLCVKGDISKSEEVDNLINSAKEKFGTIDIMVNNAGITKDALIIRMKEEDFDNVIDVNLKGVFNCLKAITPIMMKQKHGKIINLSSVVGITGNAGQVNYSASKAGVIGMTKSLAREVGSRGINVNAVAPGYIETDMTEALADKYKEEMKKTIPLKRLGKASDVANVVAFLASESADYVTGQVIQVDGGMLM
ncbi:3-oxoacyl-[acyl-carrier-protein] reductase [Clostridium beijerinckii]|jgi:3-oxoacyl-[acyl-carrier-protein] reductase (EC 1.1.1.100)|uniref:3-oxoacyl-[acyl-carrier-protein] reductase n=2 Tax=Clostridium beijerinckii TaxID=1520 RepID=A0A1S8RK40_CLOBE|nr:3-oxoacyl-[acyl-carrier-protein] reductase [Clostridium beijerinckii]ABR33255.1 3-oxoacyl-(acyl-carrier-protein) reductase [Clostridium beijerinckii NCIMB 8052]AIU00260.1 3-ketoacyl-(acyl-carrier-protein) reductase [Clostridium beijerinckii ATCC 35702]MBF7811846.1 3-oxoacyl-[acyl-carrier-protein] reductase [Clostridium beijerinckii]NOW92931.1 3-oxoacyl-[acyl-carrier protein] reductase [Clostridium beijerinckii]NRT25497.1 3-oxoacyl-[acyl-carrier protein] reductase [Clostridium beijerinckii]